MRLSLGAEGTRTHDPPSPSLSTRGRFSNASRVLGEHTRADTMDLVLGLPMLIKACSPHGEVHDRAAQNSGRFPFRATRR